MVNGVKIQLFIIPAVLLFFSTTILYADTPVYDLPTEIVMEYPWGGGYNSFWVSEKRYIY
jgi:hypothetical protein